MREGIVRVVEKMGHRAVETADAEQAEKQLSKTKFDLLISDYKLPGMTGIELLEKIKLISPETEAMLITAYGSIELAVEAMKKGAADFITKPFSPEELTLKVNLILERVQQKAELQRVSEENRYLRDQLDGQFNFGEIIGNSPAMQAIFRTIEKVAKGDSSIIIYGESGTGKELVAHAIHNTSPRKDRAFIRVNCGALAEGILESELFGHEKGAFTGAIKRRKGRFELAQSGSIFLDEIGDIPLGTQVKLLRVLQEKEFERVGGEETLSVDTRIIAATSKNLQEEIKRGNFREDLYYRLHIIPIHLPPLRERKEDISLLTEHFIKKISKEVNIPELKIEAQAIDKLRRYNWPGNVREFENVLERAAVLSEDAHILASDLPLFSEGAQTLTYSQPDGLNLNRTLETTEKQLLEKAMDKARGVKTEAAKLLDIKTSALYYKLEKYDLL
ncbi:MAG: sigma-54-dependent Fis family transcriptional regulator [Caldithrix sp.]|nr:MAG: sigma-54-dependent Fis family transcriptional regulator [Caldithrix sp.]